MAMQMWYNVPQTPVDVVGALALNFGVSHMAAQSPNLRWIPFGQTDNAFLDARFLGGVAGIGAAMFGGAQVARVGVDAAHGLLGSFIATERVRAASIARMQQGGQTAPPWGQPAPQPAALPAPAAAALPAPPAAPAAQVIDAAARAAQAMSGGYGSYA